MCNSLRVSWVIAAAFPASETGFCAAAKKERVPRDPLRLIEVRRSSPRVRNLLEERHDLVDDGHEGAVVILSSFNSVATICGVHVKDGQLAGCILVDQLRSVA